MSQKKKRSAPGNRSRNPKKPIPGIDLTAAQLTGLKEFVADMKRQGYSVRLVPFSETGDGHVAIDFIPPHERN